MKRVILTFLSIFVVFSTLLHAEVPTKESVTKLYVATFNRAPDVAGLEYWLNDSGLDLERIAQSFFDQSETQEMYPESVSDREFIKIVYSNLFNREPDADGWDYWEAELESGRVGKSVFILAVMNGAQGDDAVILENKREVGLFYVENNLNDIELAKSVMENVTAELQSVTGAEALISVYLEPDTEKPVIRIIGENPMTLTEGERYIEQGATATDNVDGSVEVKIYPMVDTSTPGTHMVTYIAEDSAGNKGAKRRVVYVTQKDVTPPVVTLNGENSITLTIGDVYVEEGATATDNVDGEIDVRIAGSVNTESAGIYTLTYTAQDSAGNAAVVARTVKVLRENTVVPIADAGRDRVMLPGDVIELNGSKSCDPDGAQIFYRWSIAGQPAGSNVLLINERSVTPSFEADKVGEYTVELVVYDGVFNSVPDAMTVSVSETALDYVELNDLAGHILTISNYNMGAFDITFCTFNGENKFITNMDFNGTWEINNNHIVSTVTESSTANIPEGTVLDIDSVNGKLTHGLIYDTIITWNGTDFGVLSSVDGIEVDPCEPPVNHPPVALDQNITVQMNSYQNPITLQGEDEDGDTLTYHLRTLPENGTLMGDTMRSLSYTPNDDFVGTDSFTFYASDGIDNSEPATVYITVENACSGMLIDDNFDDELVGSLPDGWTIKYGGTGGWNQKIVDTMSVSPNHSFQLEGDRGWAANIYKELSSVPDRMTVEANINMERVVSAWTGWFALYNKDEGTWGTQVGGLSFYNGKFSAYYGGGDHYEIDNFSANQWYNVKIEYNIANRTYQIYIDGELVTGLYNGEAYTTFPMHPTVNPAQLMLTAGNGGRVKVFYDDVKVCNSTIPKAEDEPWPVDDSFQVDVDHVLYGDVSVNDILSSDGGNEWMLGEVALTYGTVTMSLDGSFVYTPPLNFYGQDVFEYIMYDIDMNVFRTARVYITVGG